MLEQMGQKFIPYIIIQDEVCTVPWHILETFFDWLESRGVQVICNGDQSQLPPIAGILPHGWLQEKEDYYKEVKTDHRAKDDQFNDLKKRIRLQCDKVQRQKISLLRCLR